MTPTSGPVEAKGDIDARDIITGIQQNFFTIFQQPFEPPADLAQLRSDYLAYLQHSYRHLDMKGILQVQQVTQQLPLAAVYVPLKAQGHQAGPPGYVAGRLLHRPGPPEIETAAAAALEIEALARPVEPVLVEEALKTDPAVVVLGDPGAGKSTLLKVLALALAQQPKGPLPILLPLNAYARRLQQGEINLSRFLGRYYATRQEKLQRVDQLFRAALAAKQAVILLDGLDEVQAERQYLVRLVQDFVAEQIPQPLADRRPPTADRREIESGISGQTSVVDRSSRLQRDEAEETVVGGQPSAIIEGNRIIVTSRIVGYNEAPLAGQPWRTYTLTDFDQADIERFISQWTRIFAVSIRGDTEPVRRQARQECDELLAAIEARPSVRRLAGNPLLLTILALIKYTGVTLPEQRVKLYELYLQALIESWNLARALDQKPVGPGINYEETVQVLAPLALWLRQENPTAGLVSQSQLENWLTGYYQTEWDLPRGQARRRGRDFLNSVEHYSNLLLERGERQYGFLHLTLEEMLAAKGLAQLYFDDPPAAMALINRTLADPGWHESLQLAVGAIGVVQQLPKMAGAILQELLTLTPPGTEPGYAVTFAGQILLDAGPAGVGRTAAKKVTAALVTTMQSAACPIRIRRDAGHTLGRLGWTPTPAPDDLILAPPGTEPTGLDAFRPGQPPDGPIWLGKYPVTNAQFGRFMRAGGYDNRNFWSDEGWAWRNGANPGLERLDDKDLRQDYEKWLAQRPAEKRKQPYYWNDTDWNNSLFPVVGISWFEAEAYSRWLSVSDFELKVWREDELIALTQADNLPSALTQLKLALANRQSKIEIRLPHEQEWERAMGGRGDFPWGSTFDPTHLNCAEAWSGQEFTDYEELRKWWNSDTESWREATTTAVTTYPQGVSPAGVWDGSGNVWEWMLNPYSSGGDTKALRGGGWDIYERFARVSSRNLNPPVSFFYDSSFRLVVAPVIL
ncbi:MAG: SUMF1/EgtB/PvdO family nonheme iron enzyme [Chloroflexi bacterium]|nr:SUMF1/EgtB/PvdO family nonheme iron enzyme [Chloroflexota bacterium]